MGKGDGREMSKGMGKGDGREVGKGDGNHGREVGKGIGKFHFLTQSSDYEVKIIQLRDSKCYSLVPRPFPPPVFDHLQYAYMEGKAWEVLSCTITSGSQRVGRCLCHRAVFLMVQSS